MPNCVKSEGRTSRCSVAGKFQSHRQKYPNSIDILGSTCCCTEAPICQSFGRMPQPLRSLGSIAAVTGVAVPNVWKFVAPHSPLALLFVKSHWGEKSPAMPPFAPLSVHDRVAVVAMRASGL